MIVHGGQAARHLFSRLRAEDQALAAMGISQDIVSCKKCCVLDSSEVLDQKLCKNVKIALRQTIKIPLCFSLGNASLRCSANGAGAQLTCREPCEGFAQLCWVAAHTA